MAITALVKSSTLVIYPDIDTAAAREIEVSGPPTFSDSFDTIERDVVRQSFSTYAPLRGLETTSGTITVELHGSGDRNKPPESSILYKGAMGALLAPTSVTTSEAWMGIDDYIGTDVRSSILDEIKWNDGTNDQSYDPKLYTHVLETLDDPETYGFREHYPIRVVNVAEDLVLVGFITKMWVAGDPHNPYGGINCLEVISECPTQVDVSGGNPTVDCGWLYSLKLKDRTSQVLALTEFTADYFRGDITKESWVKNLSTEFSIDFQTGQVVLPSFNFEGGGVGYGNVDGVDVPYEVVSPTTYPYINSTFDSEHTSPLIVQLADVMLEVKDPTGAIIGKKARFYQECISGIQITLTNEVFKKECLASIGVGEVVRTSRAVTGSLNTFYTDLAFQEAFKQDTFYICRMIFNYAYQLATNKLKDYTSKPGNIVALSIPQLKFSEVSVEEDTGIFKYNNAFAAEPIEGDDEFYLAFL